MKLAIDLDEISKRINLSNGVSIIMVDRLGKEKNFSSLECAKNIFAIDQEFNVIWQIYTDFDSSSGPFTNIFLDGDILKGYRWDGGIYNIDLNSGIGTPASLAR